jgi:hypothetical protein
LSNYFSARDLLRFAQKVHGGIEHRVGSCRIRQWSLDAMIGRHTNAFERVSVEFVSSDCDIQEQLAGHDDEGAR